MRCRLLLCNVEIKSKWEQRRRQLWEETSWSTHNRVCLGSKVDLLAIIIDSALLKSSQSQRVLVKKEFSVLLALENESTQFRRGNSDEICILGHAPLVYLGKKQTVYSLVRLLRHTAIDVVLCFVRDQWWEVDPGKAMMAKLRALRGKKEYDEKQAAKPN
jgi:hypothetical protein